MQNYEQVWDLAFAYEDQVEVQRSASQKYVVGGDTSCWNVKKDNKEAETSKSKEKLKDEEIVKLMEEIGKLKIQLKKMTSVKKTSNTKEKEKS